jgi:hypothetical protein
MNRICVHCGARVGESGNKNNHSETGTFCDLCWKLYHDIKWYNKHNLPVVANYLKGVLDARKKRR